MTNITIQTEGTSDGNFRYGYTKIWNKDIKAAIFILINPSKGTELKLDNTIVNINNYCVSNDFGGFTVLNLFPLMATNPREISGRTGHKSKENIDFIKSRLKDAKYVFIAWGTTDEHKKKKKEIENLLQNHCDCSAAIKCWKDRNETYPKHLRIYSKSWSLVEYKYKYLGNNT